MFDPATLIGGGAIMAVVVACWDYLKLYLSKIYSLFFIRISLDSDDLRKALVSWSMNKTIQSRLTIRNFTSLSDFVKPLSKTQSIAYETPSPESTVHWLGKKPLIISESRTITFFRWTFNANQLVKEIMDYYNSIQGDNQQENRFFIRKFQGTLQQNKNNHGSSNSQHAEISPLANKGHDISDNHFYNSIKNSLTPIGWKKEDIGQVKRPDPLSHLALSDECLSVVEEVRRWRNSEEWYKARNIPFKKGILLYGTPGNCKSTLSKSLAMELNLPIMIFDLSNMSNSDFSENWDRVKNNTPCMVLLEDFDAIFDGRKNVVHEEGGLSFDCLLNCIDGVESSDGILIVATTNCIDKIDPAFGKPDGNEIATRPGRIDRAIELLNPDEAGRYKIAKRILKDYPSEIDKVVADGCKDSGAQFQERCTRVALQLFWIK